VLRTRREFLGASLGAFAGARAAADAATRRAPSAGEWSALRRSLAGTLVRPADAGYAQARLVYDLRFAGASPQAVAYCASEGDVQRVVDFCRRHQIDPIPRCGGHSYGGYSTGSGVIVDVGPMNRVSVDRGIATVGAGTRLADLYAALAARGVLVPGGSCPTVGISGLALGGGNGVVSRNYGLTADRLASLRVVTADGRVLEADGSSHSDLYWASRGGGGGNFGVATSFRLRTSPVPPIALFTLDYPWAAAGDLLGAWMEWVRHAPDPLWANLQLLSAGSSGLIAKTTGVWCGSLSSLDGQLAKLTRAVGRPPVSTFAAPSGYLNAMLVEAGCAEITLAQCHIQAPGTAGTLPRATFTAKSAYFSTPPPPGVITDTLEAAQHELPGIGVALAFDAFGGAINRVARGATAFVHRDAIAQLQMVVSYASAAQYAAVRSWLSHAAAAIVPHSNGQAYQNYIDPTLANWRSAYYGSNLARLQAVKHRYDPDGAFRFAQAIP